MLASTSPTDWALPRATQNVIKGVRVEDRHPVIQLDRLSTPGNQQQQRESLQLVSRTLGNRECLDEVNARRNALLRTIAPHETWTQTTIGPLTLHFSRTNGLENAGLALHPIYGFAYLPATGLKGMARAMGTLELGLDAELIRHIFGNEPGESNESLQTVGAIVFHDAWPTSWPRLTVDIVNNHHQNYYQGTDAPGDWESPNPVNFLAIQSHTEFCFWVSARRRDTQPHLVRAAVECLQAALSCNGAGAKAAAGYGWFQPLGKMEAVKRSLQTEYELTLTSPAFLAGSAQSKEDCELRPATIRGQLRSWWRTLHAGCITVDELRRLEGALWGDTNVGAAIRFAIEPLGQPTIKQHEHPTERVSGVKYLAYGMVRRMKMDAGMRWKLKVSIHESQFNSAQISREEVAREFESALGLLARFGGVGAKGRKGFGSLAVAGDIANESLQIWKESAIALRKKLRLPEQFNAELAESAAIFDPSCISVEVKCSASSAMDVLEQCGRAYQTVASSYKHQKEKVTLGLPRKIHGPNKEPLRHQTNGHLQPIFLRCDKTPSTTKPADARHSSPFHLHIQQDAPQTWTVRLIAFPMKYLPNWSLSIGFQKAFTDKFIIELGKQKGTSVTQGQTHGSPVSSPRQSLNAVQVTILEEKQLSGKIGFKVQEEGKRPGMLVDGEAPNPLPKVGDKVMVYWLSTSDSNSPRYRWSPLAPPKPSGKDKHKR